MTQEKYKGPMVKDTETFIRKAEWVHGNKYDYSISEYMGCKTKISIVCPKHGVFQQVPSNHTSGKGCYHCGVTSIKNKSTKDTAYFITRSIEVHGNRYNYDKSHYQGYHKKVSIVCPLHGEFKQSPASHINGSGCIECAAKASLTKSSKDFFLEKCKKKYGDKFDYSKVEYVNHQTNVTIVCPLHGEFEQSPANHLSKNSREGCARCSWENIKWNPRSAYGLNGQYNREDTCHIYVISLGSSFIKIGLALNLKRRLREIKRQSRKNVEIKKVSKGPAKEMFHLEQSILLLNNLKRFYPKESFAGSTECLELSELPKVLQIIEDWEKSNEESFSEIP